LECETDECPWNEIHSGGGRDYTCPREEDREVDVTGPRRRVSPGNHPRNNWQESADQEKENKRAELGSLL